MSEPRDPLRYFRVEARELVDELGRGALLLEKEPGPALAAQLLRSAHTLKGAARVVKQRAIAENAHAIEEALAPLRTPGVALEPDAIRAVLALVDGLSAELKALEPNAPAEAPTTTAAPTKAALPPIDPVRSVRVEISEVDTLLEGLSEASIHVRSLHRTLENLAAARTLVDTLVLGDGHVATTTLSPRSRALVDEIRTALSSVETELGGGLDSVGRELVEIRAAAEQLRLVPVGAMFGVLERVAHDAGQAIGRPVELTTRGGEIRLDANVLASVQSAFVQLVRNAVAHGLEAPAERTRLGKPQEGQIEVSAIRRGGRVMFACVDDGRGFDIAAVRAEASRKRAADEAAVMDERELVNLLFEGGLSTSKSVTEVSGRGIGLDLVRDVASSLGGEIRVDNRPGQGVRIEIVVPVALTSTEAILVEAADITAAIPADAVRGTLRIAEAEIARTSTGESIGYEGQRVPLLSLDRALGRAAPVRREGMASIIVVTDQSAVAAVRVSRLVGIASIVVRPVPVVARSSPLVAGAALDAEGVPQLVLEPTQLVALALNGDAPLPVPPVEHELPILVIDDSLTTRRLEQSILEAAGFEVDTAMSAEEGLVKAKARRYRIFLVDVEMPGMSGFDFIAQTKQDPALRDTPAILVTSRNLSEDHARAEEVGAYGYVVKGEFDQKELLALIRSARTS